MTPLTQLAALRKSRSSTPVSTGTRLNSYLKNRIPHHLSTVFNQNNSKLPRQPDRITDSERDTGVFDAWNAVLAQQVAERTAAEERAKKLQALAVELIEAEERERQRIAHLLHEDLQQIIAAARFQLQSACERLRPEPMLENVLKLLEETIGKSRSLSHSLSPPVLHCLGLTAGLKWLVREMREKCGMQIHLKVNATRQRESTPLQVFLFRAAQELLFNTFKHAGVRSARVRLSSSGGGLVLVVSDQGCGFDPAIIDSSVGKVGLGLMSIRERAVYSGCDLKIESAPGKGSRFILTVPPELANSGAEPLTLSV